MDRHKHNVSHGPSVDLFHWDNADPLADMFLLFYGAVPPPKECGTDYATLISLHLAGANKIIINGGEVPLLDPTRMTLSSLGRAFVRQHYVVSNPWNSPGFYIGECNRFDDLVNFWNLRATDVRLQFFDPRHSGRLDAFRQAWVNELPNVTRSLQDHEGPVVWHRGDMEIGNHQAFGEQITHCHIDIANWNGQNLRAPYMYFSESSSLGALSMSHGKSTASFALTDKPFNEDWQCRNQHFVLSIDPGIGLFQNERETLHPPFIPELNEHYGREYYFKWSDARAEPGSLGIINSVMADDLTLHGLEVAELISKIFGTVGIEATLSKPGLVARSLIRQMGGLSGCRSFKIAGVRSLIEGHKPNQSFSRGEAMQTIRGQGADRPLSEYQWLYIEQRDIGSELKNGAVFSYLLDKGVFRAGLKFDCPSCQLEFWRSLDDATSQAECEYCGHQFNVSRQLRDKDWAFRRSGLFGPDNSQEGAIPVTLALQQLEHVHGFNHGIYTTAMMLKPKGASIFPCETDFVVVTSRGRDSRVQIAIGECKTRKPITADDVRNLTAVADAFPRNYDVYIVFARLTAFTPEEIELIRPINSKWQRRAIMLTERELEPYFIYERTEKEFDIDRTAVTFEDMATVTERVFFQNRRKKNP